MGSHYYEPNINVEKRLETCREDAKRLEKILESGTLDLEMRISRQDQLRVERNCINYLLDCQKQGITYISVADLPLL